MIKMKITPAELNKVESAYEAALKTTENRSSDHRSVGLPRDRVCLSDESRKYSELDLANAEAARKAEQSTSPEKLRRLKAAIENGTYEVSGRDIADAIIGK